MSRIGKGELVYGELLTVDEVLARIDAVDAGGRPGGRRGRAAPARCRLAVIGPFDDDATSPSRSLDPAGRSRGH